MSQDQWFVVIDGKEVGPLTPADLKRLATEQRIAADAPVRRGDMDHFVPAARIKGLFPSSAPVTPKTKGEMARRPLIQARSQADAPTPPSKTEEQPPPSSVDPPLPQKKLREVHVWIEGPTDDYCAGRILESWKPELVGAPGVRIVRHCVIEWPSNERDLLLYTSADLRDNFGIVVYPEHINAPVGRGQREGKRYFITVLERSSAPSGTETQRQERCSEVKANIQNCPKCGATRELAAGTIGWCSACDDAMVPAGTLPPLVSTSASGAMAGDSDDGRDKPSGKTPKESAPFNFRDVLAKTPPLPAKVLSVLAGLAFFLALCTPFALADPVGRAKQGVGGIILTGLCLFGTGCVLLTISTALTLRFGKKRDKARRSWPRIPDGAKPLSQFSLKVGSSPMFTVAVFRGAESQLVLVLTERFKGERRFDLTGYDRVYYDTLDVETRYLAPDVSLEIGVRSRRYRDKPSAICFLFPGIKSDDFVFEVGFLGLNQEPIRIAQSGDAADLRDFAKLLSDSTRFILDRRDRRGLNSP